LEKVSRKAFYDYDGPAHPAALVHEQKFLPNRSKRVGAKETLGAAAYLPPNREIIRAGRTGIEAQSKTRVKVRVLFSMVMIVDQGDWALVALAKPLDG